MRLKYAVGSSNACAWCETVPLFGKATFDRRDSCQEVVAIDVAHVPYPEDLLAERAETPCDHCSVLLAHRLSELSVLDTLRIVRYGERACGQILHIVTGDQLIASLPGRQRTNWCVE